MSANCTDRSTRPAGFTLVELVVIIVLLGILSVVVLPRFDSKDFSDALFRDQVGNVLGEARRAAVARRRLVCADIQSSSVSLNVATTAGATACDQPLKLASGDTALQSKDAANTISGTPLTLYFQPNGRITQDGSGATVYTGSLSVNAAQLAIVGDTGYVR